MFVVAPSHSLHHPHHAAAFVPHGRCRKFVVTPATAGGCPSNKRACTVKKECPVKATTTTTQKSTTDTTTGRVFTERTPIHQKESEKVAIMALDVTGFTTDDLQVNIDDHVVSVNGTRQNRLGDTYVIRRRFKLDRDTVDEENIRVHLTDGVLEIVVPKKAQVGPRTLTISTDRVQIEADPAVEEEESDEDMNVRSNTAKDENDDTNKKVVDDSTTQVETVQEDNEEEVEKENVTSGEQQGVVEDAWEDVVQA